MTLCVSVMFLLLLFFIVQPGLLMVRITDPWGVFLISTPFLYHLLAQKSQGASWCLLFAVLAAMSLWVEGHL